MKGIKEKTARLAMGGIAFLAVGSAANAASLEPPGWTSGFALGAEFPQGVYFIDNAALGGWRGIDDHEAALTTNIPVIAWVTPWTIAGGRIEAFSGAPEISGSIPQLPKLGSPSWAGRDYTAFYTAGAFVGAQWNLGNGFGFSAFIGGWAPAENELRHFGFDSWVLSERVNLAYVADNWKLAANLTFGQPGNSRVTTVLGSGQILPDYFNYDLTATKTIGKWEVGLVAFGSTDTSKHPYNGLASNVANGTPFGEQSQFAMGGLVGYNFPGITLQLYATRDVFSENYFNLADGSKSYETRVWTRATIPLWLAPSAEPLK